MSAANNLADAAPLMLQALQAQAEADELIAQWSDLRDPSPSLYQRCKDAKARALALRDAALARANADPVDAMVTSAIGRNS